MFLFAGNTYKVFRNHGALGWQIILSWFRKKLGCFCFVLHCTCNISLSSIFVVCLFLILKQAGRKESGQMLPFRSSTASSVICLKVLFNSNNKSQKTSREQNMSNLLSDILIAYTNSAYYQLLNLHTILMLHYS